MRRDLELFYLQHQRDEKAAFWLSVVLGPLGLYYVSVKWASVLLLVTLVTMPTVIGPLVCWIASMMMAKYLAQQRNEELWQSLKQMEDEENATVG